MVSASEFACIFWVPGKLSVEMGKIIAQKTEQLQKQYYQYWLNMQNLAKQIMRQSLDWERIHKLEELLLLEKL